MWYNNLFVLLLWFTCSTYVKGQTPNIEAILQDACFRECRPDRPGSTRGLDVCYISHPSDCFKFVICIPLPQMGTMYTQVMSCAFGTMWNGTEKACQRSDLVKCGNDPCRNGTETMHKSDLNCRTYWKCVDLVSMPDCCPRYRRFDPQTKQCVRDFTCDATCPLLNDATCTGPGVSSLDYKDENCKTHFRCVEGRPVPKCCPDGYGYDPYIANCTVNQNCTAACPLDYKDRCSMPGVTAYALTNDSNCRTYIKCSSEGVGEAYCCRSGMEFDANLKICVDARSLACINTMCPRGYREECRLESVPGQRHVYKNLDYFGGREMPCPVGTMFIQKRCQCDLDPTVTPVIPGLGACVPEIHANLPSLKNNGSVVAAIMMVGKYGQGEKGVGNISVFWDGDDGVNIPYFGSQEPPKLYVEIIFNATGRIAQKQVLLSSCKYLGDKISLEISLESPQFMQENIGTLIIRMASPGIGLHTNLTMQYELNQQHNLKLIYDGLEAGYVGAILTKAAGPPEVKGKSFRGRLPIHISGLRLTKCRYERGVAGFIGHVYEFKISKCLTPTMVSELAEIAKATRQLQNNPIVSPSFDVPV